MKDDLRHIGPGIEIPEFDPLDDDLLHDLMGNERLGKAAGEILSVLWQIEATETFSLNKERAFEWLREAAVNFRKALKEEYEEGL